MDKISEIRQRIDNLLIKKPMSYRQLAALIGTDERTFVDFVKMRRRTTVLTLSRIEKYLIEIGA